MAIHEKNNMVKEGDGGIVVDVVLSSLMEDEVHDCNTLDEG